KRAHCFSNWKPSPATAETTTENREPGAENWFSLSTCKHRQNSHADTWIVVFQARQRRCPVRGRCGQGCDRERQARPFANRWSARKCDPVLPGESWCELERS